MSTDSDAGAGRTHTHPDDTDVDRKAVRSALIDAIRDRVAVSARGDGVPEAALVGHAHRETGAPGWVVQAELGQAIRDGQAYYVGQTERRYKLTRATQARVDRGRATDRVRRRSRERRAGGEKP